MNRNCMVFHCNWLYVFYCIQTYFLLNLIWYWTQKNLESKIKKEKRKQEEGQGKHDEKYKEMQATIERNETVIQMLKMQLAQFQQRRNSEVESVSLSSNRICYFMIKIFKIFFFHFELKNFSYFLIEGNRRSSYIFFHSIKNLNLNSKK